MDVDSWQGLSLMFLSLTAVMQSITLWAVCKRLKMHIEQRHHDGRN